jgi:hypothetical protein
MLQSSHQETIHQHAAFALPYRTQAKIYAVGWVLWAAGKTKEANLLKTAFKAFNVYNSRRYDRECAPILLSHTAAAMQHATIQTLAAC